MKYKLVLIDANDGTILDTTTFESASDVVWDDLADNTYRAIDKYEFSIDPGTDDDLAVDNN